MTNRVASNVDSEPAASSAKSEIAFDMALHKAQQQELTPEEQEFMIEGIVTVGSQILLSPLANDILSEARSDD